MLIFALACSSPAPDPPAAKSTPEVRAGDEGTPLDDHMKEHFKDATIGIEAWVAGDFDSAYSRLGYLSKHPAAKGVPEDQKAKVDAMQAAAARAAEPAPPEQTAQALGELGAACGECHAAVGVKPQIVLSDMPKPSADVQPHMVGHLWAVRALWIGLVTNDDEPWAKGAKHLSGDALHGEAFGDESLPEHLVGFAEAVHTQGREAAKATTREARVAAFTGVVRGCGDCHLEMRGE